MAKTRDAALNPRKAARIFKALSNPNRLELYLELLRKHEASFETGCECLVSDVIKKLKVGAPTISHHLKELASAGLIETERRGRYVVARINVGTIEQARRVLSIRGSED